MEIKNMYTDSVSTIRRNNMSNSSDCGGSFSQSFKSKAKEELEVYINDIKKKGNRLAITQNYVDVLNYKKTIKDYLKAIVENAYCLNKDTNFWQNQYYTIVETINDKLEVLTKEILEEEKEFINIASTIDNIQGLLVDIYK